MTGEHVGVGTQITMEVPRAIRIHCFNHNGNLGVSEAIQVIEIIADCLGITFDVINFFEKSPKQTAKLKKLKLEAFDNRYVGII